MGPIVLLLAVAASPPLPSLEALTARVRSAPAWQAAFTQTYIPAGLDTGTEDHGELVVTPPDRLRFDYSGESPRTFAFDGEVARSVDPTAATCDATRIDRERLDRLPLSILLDPSSAAGRFQATIDGDELVLRPIRPDPDVAEIRIVPGVDGMPARFALIDGDGNRNRFTFSSWTPRSAPSLALFQPSLPGAPPCQPRNR